MSATKIIIAVFLFLLLLVLGRQILFFWQKNSTIGARYLELKTELVKVQADYNKMQEDFNYYLNPENLEKELRAKFNYKQFGEKMLIIVPQKTSSSSGQ